jgi:hypothetical protein
MLDPSIASCRRRDPAGLAAAPRDLSAWVDHPPPVTNRREALARRWSGSVRAGEQGHSARCHRTGVRGHPPEALVWEAVPWLAMGMWPRSTTI